MLLVDKLKKWMQLKIALLLTTASNENNKHAPPAANAGLYKNRKPPSVRRQLITASVAICFTPCTPHL